MDEDGAPRPRRLSPRQQQVLRLLAAGGTHREMAEALGISEATMAVHVDRVFLRLGVHDRGEAVEEALARGLLDPEELAPGELPLKKQDFRRR